MNRLEDIFFHLIERRRRGRMLIGLGLVGFLVLSLAFLLLGFVLMPLRRLKAMMVQERSSQSLTAPEIVVH